MELHRLQTMKEGYSEDLFNKLYEETKPLRKKLVRQIDPRYYGVSSDIIESWFDDKFIFVFNKYFDNKDPQLLRGFIINALQTFKYRILRKAYNKEGVFYSSNIQLEGESQLINIIPDSSLMSVDDTFYNLALEFMKERLSDNAYLLLQVQLDPPPYILSRIKNHNSRLPNDLLAEFLGLDMGSTSNTDRYLRTLKREITEATKSAKTFFENKDVLALPI